MGKVKYRDKPCKICGAIFTPTGSGSKFCGDCQETAAQVRRERYEAGRRKVRATKNDIYTCDSMENVMRCLSCNRTHCTGNCPNVSASPGEKAPKGKELAVRKEMEEMARRILAGETRKEIVESMGMTVNTYTYRRNQCKAAGLIPETW